MPKTEQTIMLTYWETRLQPDRHDLTQMRALADAGVYDAQFFAAQRKSFFMRFRADEGDEAQLSAAIAYAKRNLFRTVLQTNVHDLEVWVDGVRFVEPETLTQQ